MFGYISRYLFKIIQKCVARTTQSGSRHRSGLVSPDPVASVYPYVGVRTPDSETIGPFTHHQITFQFRGKTLSRNKIQICLTDTGQLSFDCVVRATKPHKGAQQFTNLVDSNCIVLFVTNHDHTHLLRENVVLPNQETKSTHERTTKEEKGLGRFW